MAGLARAPCCGGRARRTRRGRKCFRQLEPREFNHSRTGHQAPDPLSLCCRGEVEANSKRMMHCPSENAKVLALHLCSTCYPLSGKTKSTSEDCAKQFWKVRATVAGLTMPQAVTSVPSSCAGGIRVEPDTVAMSRLPREGSPHESRSLGDAATLAGAMARTAPPWA